MSTDDWKKQFQGLSRPGFRCPPPRLLSEGGLYERVRTRATPFRPLGDKTVTRHAKRRPPCRCGQGANSRRAGAEAFFPDALAGCPLRAARPRRTGPGGGAPRKFLEAILLAPARNRVVGSQRGKFGGDLLARPATEISFAETIRIIVGPLALAPCVSRSPFRKCDSCPDLATCSCGTLS